MTDIETIEVKPPAAPANNAVAILFNSTRMNGGTVDGATAGWLRNHDITWFEVSFLSVNQASAASGLKCYASSDNGATWDLVEVFTIAATTAGVVDTYRRYVGGYRDYKVELTAGATGPTVWRLTIKLTRGDHAKVLAS